jgi:regulator of sigma E protease
MLTIIAFVVALALLIAVHEYGHYRVAVACGVKVLRFSIGFGKPLLTWRPKKQKPGQDTEFVIAILPLGGYVKMLDEREAPVPVEIRHLAFNTQPLRSRAAIVLAGPMANLLLAVLLYAGVNWIGVQEPRAIVASPSANSLAAKSGLRSGDQVLSAAIGSAQPQEIRSMEDLRWLTTQAALDGADLLLVVKDTSSNDPRNITLPLSRMDVREADANMFRNIGIGTPWSQPMLGDLVTGGAAQQSGLKKDDLILSVSGVLIADGTQLREVIRASVDGSKPIKQIWQIHRSGQVLAIDVTTQAVREGGMWVGKVGAFVGAPPSMVQVRYGPIDGLWRGVVKTWDVSSLTLRMMGKMLIGEASLKNLSGPMTIADVAGKSASLGAVQYLLFLALISVSLGVLNLLPLPVLDGGHLMYYVWEAVTGKAVTEAWLERLQRGGVVVLMLMMGIAWFNDVTRIFRWV